MLLHFSTWAEIERFLERSKTVVIPIGSNEQHGPTGLLGTDWLCPEIIAHEAQKDADILVAPTFNIGMAQHHLDFPGTIAVEGDTFIHYVTDIGKSLAHHGFRKILLVNGHGSNVPFLDIAARNITNQTEASCAMVPWWSLIPKELLNQLRESEFPGGMAHGHGVQPPIVLADFETRGLARFDFVQNAIINVLERGADDF